MHTLYPKLSHSWPQTTRPPALKMAATVPTMARKWSSWMKVWPYTWCIEIMQMTLHNKMVATLYMEVM